MDKEWAQILLTGALAGCLFALFVGWGLLLLLQELTPPEEAAVKESISWSH